MPITIARPNPKSFVGKATAARSDAWVTRAPEAEAYDLYRTVRYGNCSIASIRRLISVPREVETVLRAYAVAYPEDCGNIERVLGFRKRVAEEFERLLQPLLPANPARVHEWPATADAAPTTVDGVQPNQEAA